MLAKLDKQRMLEVQLYLCEKELITKRELEIVKISINDRTLILTEDKNKLRAEILKGIIMVILS